MAESIRLKSGPLQSAVNLHDSTLTDTVSLVELARQGIDITSDTGITLGTAKEIIAPLPTLVPTLDLDNLESLCAPLGSGIHRKMSTSCSRGVKLTKQRDPAKVEPRKRGERGGVDGKVGIKLELTGKVVNTKQARSRSIMQTLLLGGKDIIDKLLTALIRAFSGERTLRKRDRLRAMLYKRSLAIQAAKNNADELRKKLLKKQKIASAASGVEVATEDNTELDRLGQELETPPADLTVNHPPVMADGYNVTDSLALLVIPLARRVRRRKKLRRLKKTGLTLLDAILL